MRTGNLPLVVFRNPTFRRLWLASLTSNFGGLIQVVGASWIMTILSGSEGMVALVQTSITLPIMLFSLLAGVLADNFDRRRVMMTAQGFMLVVAFVLAALAYLDMLTPWLLLSLTFLIGCGTALHNPSWQASVGDIVSHENVPSAVALNGMGFNIVRSIGPALGGFIVAAAGASAAFALNAVSYFAIIWALWRWRPVQASRVLPRESFGAAFVAGLRYVTMSPNLISVMFLSMLFGSAAISVQALLPLIVRDQLGRGAIAYGVLLGCFGVGAVIGAIASPGLRARFPNEGIARTCFIGLALGIIVVAYSNFYVISGLTMFASGGFWLVTMSLSNATVQMSSPRWVVGRTVALYQTGAFGGMAVGSWIWGQIAEGYSVQVALLAAAALLAAGALAGRIAPFPDFEGLDLEPLNHFREPQLKLELSNRSGPIMIMIDYEIAENDIPEFLGLMHRRRRIRVRDGARRWTLLRDLENPDVWTEAYHVPTWVEYVRHHARRTRADREVNENLSRLHKGQRPQRVHRMIERSLFN